MSIAHYYRVAYESYGMLWLTEEGLDDPNTKIIVVVVGQDVGYLSQSRGCLVLKDDVYYQATLIMYSQIGLLYRGDGLRCKMLVEKLRIYDG